MLNELFFRKTPNLPGKDVPKVILFFQSQHIYAKFFVIKTKKNRLYFLFFEHLF